MKISEADLEKARSIDLVTWFQLTNPGELVRRGRDSFVTKTHDSLFMSNGLWHWYSRKIGGRNALDYLIKVEGMKLPDAVASLIGNVSYEQLPALVSPQNAERKERTEFVLPPRNFSAVGVTNYLTGRGISESIINFCVKSGALYEDSKYHNCVFVGYDREGNPRYAMKRGTRGQAFKGEETGSDKRFSFRIPASLESDMVSVFEAPIDLLSFATMAEVSGQEWRSHHLLSLAGVYRPGKNESEMTIPIALSEFLDAHPGVRKIVLRLDNDETGRAAAQGLQATLSKRYQVRTVLPTVGKDYNEMLCIRLGVTGPGVNEHQAEQGSAVRPPPQR